MNNRITNMLTVLIQKDVGYGILNNFILNDLDKIDSRISKRIRQKFRHKTPQKSKYSENEYFDAVLKNLARQILIAEEIEIEIQNIANTPNNDTKIILKNLRQICTMLKREKNEY